jgi:hypothetical protein
VLVGVGGGGRAVDSFLHFAGLVEVCRSAANPTSTTPANRTPQPSPLPPPPTAPTQKTPTQSEGFSPEITDRFFRPFLGGIFFDATLSTSSRLFAFVMRMLATGQNCLPAGGIGAVAEQLAARLKAGSLVLGGLGLGVAGRIKTSAIQQPTPANTVVPSQL